MQAIIMAGGKGSRIGLGVEKPLIRVGNLTMIERVYRTLSLSNMFDSIIVALSPFTPETLRFCRKKGYQVYIARGRGYCFDLHEVICNDNRISGKVLVVNSDLPLLTLRGLKIASRALLSTNKPASSVIVRIKDYLMLNPNANLANKTVRIHHEQYVYIGINLLESEAVRRAGETEYLPEERVIVPMLPDFISVDTFQDLLLVVKLLKR